MKYADGKPVTARDRVKLWNGQHGIVVCSIDTREFSPEYPKSHWSYLKSGIIIKTDTGEIFHYTEPDEDLELIKSNAGP